MSSHAIQLRNFYQFSFPEFDVNVLPFNPFKDFQPDQMQRSSLKIFTAHYAYRNADLNLTPVTGTTNGFIFSNNQFINRIFQCGKLDLPWLLTLDFVCLLFYLQYRPVQTDTPATGAANIGGLNFSCLFERAEIQMPPPGIDRVHVDDNVQPEGDCALEK